MKKKLQPHLGHLRASHQLVQTRGGRQEKKNENLGAGSSRRQKNMQVMTGKM